MRHMKSAVTGTLQEKNGKFYLVLRIPDSTGKAAPEMGQHRIAGAGQPASRQAAARREVG